MQHLDAREGMVRKWATTAGRYISSFDYPIRDRYGEAFRFRGQNCHREPRVSIRDLAGSSWGHRAFFRDRGPGMVHSAEAG